MELQKEGSAHDFLCLAMAYGQLGQHEQARAWYGRAVAWMEKHPSQDQGLESSRTAVEKLLGIQNTLPAKKKLPAGP